MPVEKHVQPCTLETFDTAMFNWLDQKLDLFVTTNEGFKKVPIIWAGTERAYQLKHSATSRDSGETMILPVITLERVTVIKEAGKGPFGSSLYYSKDRRKNVFTVSRQIQPLKTRNFANAEAKRSQGTKNTNRFKNKEIVYEFVSIPTPTWVKVNYKIRLRAEYQQQMNTLLTPFMNRYGNVHSFFLAEADNGFEAFIDQSFTFNNNLATLETSERRFETEIGIRMEGSLIGDGENQAQQTVAIRENQVKVRFGKEKTIFEP